MKAKRTSSMQYDNRKSGTHAPVFAQTLLHGNSKNEYDEETEEDKQNRVSMKSWEARTK